MEINYFTVKINLAERLIRKYFDEIPTETLEIEV